MNNVIFGNKGFENLGGIEGCENLDENMGYEKFQVKVKVRGAKISMENLRGAKISVENLRDISRLKKDRPLNYKIFVI